MAAEKEVKKAEARKAPEHSGTPSSIALAEVGQPKEGASDEELVEHAERYLEVKRKARWG